MNIIRCLLLFIFPMSLFAQNPAPRLVLPIGHTEKITTAVFSPGGKLVLTGGEDHKVKLWDKAGREVQNFRGHKHPIINLAFSPNADSIFSCDKEGVVRIWNRSGQELDTIQANVTVGGYVGRSVKAMTFAPEHRLFFMADKKQVMIWDYKGVKVDSITIEGIDIKKLSYSPKQSLLAIGDKLGWIYLWNVAEDKKDTTFRAHEGAINSLSFSSDGKALLSSSEKGTHRFKNPNTGSAAIRKGSVKIWDLQGKELFAFTAASKRGDRQDKLSGSAYFSAQHSIAYAFSNDSLLSYNLQTKAKQAYGIGYPAHIPAISTLEGIYLRVKGETASLRSLSGEQKPVFLKSLSSPIHSVSVSSDESSIILGTNYHARVWNFTKREHRLVLGPLVNTRNSRYNFSKSLAVAFSGNGSQAYTANAPIYDNLIISSYLSSLSLEKDTSQRNAKMGLGTLKQAVYNQDGKYIFYLSNANPKNKSIRDLPKLWDISAGREVASFAQNELFVRSLAISHDGKRVLTGYHRDMINLWDVATKKKVSLINGQLSKDLRSIKNGHIQALAFSSDDTYFLAARSMNNRKYIISYNLQGKPLFTYPNLDTTVSILKFSSDGQHFLSGHVDGTARLWKVGKKTPVQIFKGHTGKITGVEFLQKKGLFLTTSEDYTCKIWTPEGTLYVTLVPLGNKDWAVVAPNGQFDASQDAMKSMHFVKGKKVIEFDQLQEGYYEPGLLGKLLGFNDEPIREVIELQDQEDYPDSEIELDGKTLDIKLEPGTGSIGQVSLIIDGREVAADINPDKDSVLSINLEQFDKYLLKGAVNTIGIKTFNAEGDLESQVNAVSFTPKPVALNTQVEGIKEKNGTENQESAPEDSEPESGPLFSKKPRLFALCIGSSDYNNGTKLDLSYADQDASEMAKAIRLSASSLFVDKEPLIQIFTTGKDLSEGTHPLPSKTNIKAAMDSIASIAEAQDVFVLYLSGHGKTYNDNWYYLTYEMNNDILSDRANREFRSISSKELKEWMTQIPARKQVLIIDACSSGKLNQDFDLLNQKDIPSSQIRSLKRLGSRAGLYVISASTANQVSYEATPYGMGLLTYGLLMGINGSALREQEYIDVSTLFNFAVEQVPTLASYINETQEPMIYKPEASKSYDIGRVTSEVKSQIKLSAPKPIFAKTHFSNKESFLDDLGLMASVNAALREYNFQGVGSQLIFVEGDNFEEAYKIAGAYTISGETITVEARLFKNGVPLGEKNIELKGSRSDLESLSKEITLEAFFTIPRP